MRTLPLLGSLALLSAAPPVLAHESEWEDQPWYLTGSGMFVVMDEENAPGPGTVDFDPGFGVALALGRDIAGGADAGLSLELEGLYTFVTIDEDELVQFPGTTDEGVGNLAWMANAILDWHVRDDLAWYLGAGVGYASGIDYETYDTGNLDQLDDDGLAFQLKAGLEYDLGGRYDFLFGYRFYRTEDVEVENLISGGIAEIRNQQHMIELGVRFGL